jgi:hypothetical protein
MGSTKLDNKIILNKYWDIWKDIQMQNLMDYMI